MKKNILIVLVLISSLFLQACFMQINVAENQAGIITHEGEIVDVVPSGTYADFDFFSDIEVVDIDIKTIEVSVEEVLLKDSWPINTSIIVQVARKSDEKSIRYLFSEWNQLKTNDGLIDIVSLIVKARTKETFREYSLDEIINNRGIISDRLFINILPDFEKMNLEFASLTLNNIETNSPFENEPKYFVPNFTKSPWIPAPIFPMFNLYIFIFGIFLIIIFFIVRILPNIGEIKDETDYSSDEDDNGEE